MSDPNEHTIFVCTSCRAPSGSIERRSGAHLLQALSKRLRGHPSLRVVGHECLSVCERPCTIAFRAPGKFAYVFGGLDPDTSAEDIAQTGELYTRSDQGLMPRKERAPQLQATIVARIPDLAAMRQS